MKALMRVPLHDWQAMRIRLWLSSAAALGAVIVLAAAWVISAPRPASSAIPAEILQRKGDPEKGRLVFAAGDCASCHASPGQGDRLRLGGGMALASPFGTFRPPNISPDPVDGIGAWQTKDLVNALLSGVSPDGSHYFPLFPYASFAHMNVADVVDLMAYLRTLPAVHGRPPPHDINPLFRFRRVLGFWKLLFFDRSPIEPDSRHDAEWNRGRYLVDSIGHCAECHSARNWLGAIENSTRLAGGIDPTGTGFIPNITPRHIGNWSKQDIVEMLKTGNTPIHMRVGSSMSEVVTNTAMLPDSDLQAIAAYIKSLPPRPTPQP